MVYVDASCFEEGVVSLGCVVKDQNTRVYLAACKRLDSHAEPAYAELMGIHLTMELAKVIKLDSVIF